jgi:hypothetical protein
MLFYIKNEALMMKNIKHSGEDPLIGSWSQRFCSIYQKQLEAGMLSQCPYRTKCFTLRAVLEGDVDSSIQVTKEILFQGIPRALESLDLRKQYH